MSPAVRENGAKERILVVDDESSIRDVVCSMLASSGYRCTPVESGHHALALLSSSDFELMLSDLMMSGMDGITLLGHTKERFPDMPVIMVTAVSDIAVALDSIRIGAYDFLQKPFEREQLLNTVRRALNTRRLQIENREYQTNLELQVAARTRQLQHAMEELEKSYDITLEALGDALDLKDSETEGHSKRVTAFTIAIARAMGLPKDRVSVIARGAFLHDIGKMAIPDRVLTKPGPLNPEEVAEMRKHCELGYQIVRKIPFLTEAAEIVYAHQERWDGTGYPRGLKGEEIPLGARIFAVADTLDAMTSDRPYRPAQSYRVARKEIEDWSGRQFDPAIVRVFLSIPESEWEHLREQLRQGMKHQVYKVPVAQLPAAGKNEREAPDKSVVQV